MAEMLSARGDVVARQARELCTERMAAIRKALRKWERDRQSLQLTLQLDDEREQKEGDMIALQARLDELDEEREREPNRLKRFYRVKDTRIYPVAYQVLLPEGRA